MMKKTALVFFFALVLPLLVAGASPAWAHHWHGHVFIGVGPGFWWGAPYPYWAYPPPYYAYPPPAVVVQEPPVYVQQPAAPAAPVAQTEWYYCPSATAYYPNVSTCPEAWVRVPAR